MQTPGRTTHLLAAVAAAALLSLTACSGGGSDSGTATTADGGGAGGSAGDVAAPEMADGAVASDSDASKAGSARNAVDLVEQQAVIRNGAVSLRSDDVGKTRFDVQALVDQHNGTIADDKTETDKTGKPLRSRMVLRVPSDDFDAVMTALGNGELADLASTSSSAEDVTTQVIDVEARIKAQQASVDRVRQLLARAESIRDIMSIEAELSNRQAQLDSLTQQQAYLADQTSLATIKVSIERKPSATPAPKKDDDHGFLAGLTAGWDGLRATVVAVLTVVGAVLPFAVVGLLVGVPVWLLIRRLRREPAAVAAPVSGGE
jgi:hypothetical protein